MKARHVYPLLLASAVFAPAAHADDLSDWLKLDGFGTIGAYKGNSKIAGVRTDSRQSVYSLDEWRFDGDSQASIQATVNPNGNLKAVVQLISKKDVKGSNQPTVEWAYVSYPLASDIDFKVGRSVAPIFLMSDYRNLNYSQTTARPQAEIYQVNPITYMDGVTLRWDKRMGGGQLQMEGFMGQTKVSVAGGDVNLKRVKGLSLKWGQDSWSVRGGYSWYNAELNAPGVKANIDMLMGLPAVVCANCKTAIPSIAVLNGITATIGTIGASYDDGEWIVQGEWAKRDTNTVVITSVSGWNLLAARRIGDFTPFIGTGKYSVHTAKPNLTPGPYAPLALKVQLNYLNESLFGTGNGARSASSIGVRWDFMKNWALKLQLDMFKMSEPKVGITTGYHSYPTSLLGQPTGFDGKVSMLTANLDFVF